MGLEGHSVRGDGSIRLVIINYWFQLFIELIFVSALPALVDRPGYDDNYRNRSYRFGHQQTCDWMGSRKTLASEPLKLHCLAD